MNEEEVEKVIQGKGLNAPRLTSENIDATIAEEDYHVFENTCLTVCCLTLKNGFTVTGESACASPDCLRRMPFLQQWRRQIHPRN